MVALQTVVQTDTSFVKVLVIDDHRSFADALCLALEQDEHVEACSAATTAEEGLVQVETSPWDVVVIDAFMGGMGGVEGSREIRRRLPDVRVVMVTGRPELDLLADAAAAGVDAFLSKEASLEDIREAILSGDAADVGSATLLAEVVEGIRQREAERVPDPPVSLTPR